MLLMLRNVIQMFMVLVFSVVCSAQEPPLSNTVDALMEKARKDGKQLTLPTNKHEEEGLQAAKEAAKVYHSPEYQEKLQSIRQSLNEEVFSGYTEPWEKELEKNEQKKASGSLAATEKVYLFFSSSVPPETVQAYIEDIVFAGEPNITLLMKGFVPGQRKKSIYLRNILKKDQDCVDQVKSNSLCPRYEIPVKLKPSLFTTFGITRVPAVVYVNQDTSYRIQGDASLEYLLEQINREVKSETLNGLINIMRGS